MTPNEIRTAGEENAALEVGQTVTVRWGYGLGFRASGRGRIVKLYAASVRVELVQDVAFPGNPSVIGWPQGFVLKRIPRFTMNNLLSGSWNECHRVEVVH